ncbi:MAG: 2-hydroxychromene-2-carboxylate isomerase [Rhodospirillaceae bacterium]|nr:2-hydroxychromene-2-carboxylate isomerase [Rhodospirillaceae bacterium]MCA8933585.1 2-hydroxychromene-2-carboxylate isomerase [Rhodospirillaceae bacterium]
MTEPGPPTIEFWFEFASTYSYPAAFAVEEAAHKRGIAVAWRAFLLGPVFAAQGWRDSPFNLFPAKGRYMWRDLERLCATQGLPLRRPSRFPRGSVLAARIACRFADAPWLPGFVRAVYAANFAEDRDIGDPAVIGDLLDRQGAGPDTLAAAQADDAKALLRAQTDQAMALGIFGAPSFLARGELFWGGDRLDAALNWVADPLLPPAA